MIFNKIIYSRPVKSLLYFGWVVGLMILILVSLSDKSYAAERCTDVPAAGNPLVGAAVYIPIYDADNNFVRYSRDYTIRVTTTDATSALLNLPRYNTPNNATPNPPIINYPNSADWYRSFGLQDSNSGVLDPSISGWYGVTYNNHVESREFRVDASNGVECYANNGVPGLPQNGYKLIFNSPGSGNANKWVLDCMFFLDILKGLTYEFELISVNDLGNQAYHITQGKYNLEDEHLNGGGYNIGGAFKVNLSRYPASIIGGLKIDWDTKSVTQNQIYSNAKIGLVGENTRESTANPYGYTGQNWVVSTRDQNGEPTAVTVQAPDPAPPNSILIGYTMCDQSDVDAGRFTRAQVDNGYCNKTKDPTANSLFDSTGAFNPVAGPVHIWWFYDSTGPSQITFRHPWFQVRNGSVVADGEIVGQSVGYPGSRPGTPYESGLPTDVTNVIIAALNAGTGYLDPVKKGSINNLSGVPKSRLCSDNLYILLTPISNISVSNCPVSSFLSEGYDYNIWDNTAGERKRTNDEEASSGHRMLNRSSSLLDLLHGNDITKEDPDRMLFKIMNLFYNVNNDLLRYPVIPVKNGKYIKWPRSETTGSGDISLCGKTTLNNSNVTNRDIRRLYNDNNSDLYFDYMRTGGHTHQNSEKINWDGDDPSVGRNDDKAQSIIFTCPVNYLTIGSDNVPLRFERGAGSALIVADKDLKYNGTQDADTSTPKPSENSARSRDLYIKSNIEVTVDNNIRVPNKMPRLSIIVSGNIYIDPSVTRIDASLYAMGHIYTCAPYGSNGNTYYRANGPACNQQLKIRGMIASRKGFVFGRSYSIVPSDSNSAAEIISVPSILYINPPIGWGRKDNDTDNNIQFVGIESSKEPPRLK